MKVNVEYKEKFMKFEGVEIIGVLIWLCKIEDVKMKLLFSFFGLFKVKLSWMLFLDNRIMYWIYRVENGIYMYVSIVNGVGEYEEKFVNIFLKLSFYVVLYNI